MGSVYEGLGIGDRAKGPGGTNEFKFTALQAPLKYTKGALAESWEMSPDGLTYTIHLRQGIRFQNKPPVNGREMVAADVKYCFDRLCGLGDFTKAGPSPYNYGGLESIKEVTTPDKNTVVFKCKEFYFALLPRILTEFATEIYPPECISLPKGLDDWRNVVGTGAFILRDYVTASSLTLKRNPDYWGYDELHPENQLPYFDVYKTLVVPDVSAQMAAMRSGQADATGYPYHDWYLEDQIRQTNPKMQFSTYDSGSGPCMYLQHDVKPLDDLRVRKALQMSLDRLAINEIFGPGGRCEPYISVINQGFGPELYTPFEELPKSIQEIRTYNPEKAKKLLAEAGYPNGFKMEVVSTKEPKNLEPLQTVADYWGRIGVKLDIQVRDTAIIDSYKKTAGQPMALADTIGASDAKTNFPKLFGPGKYMRHNDQHGEELYAKACSTVDQTERNKLFKELNYYVMENVYFIGIVKAPPYVSMVQPWIRGWYGECQLRRLTTPTVFVRCWLDQNMKQAMTGR